MDRWTDDDRTKVLGFRAWDSDRCPQCGTFPDDWLDSKGRIRIDPPFVAEVIACQGCRDIAEVQQDIDASKDPGLRPRLVQPPLHPDDADEAAAD